VNYRTSFRTVVVAQLVATILADWATQATRTALPSPLREFTLAQPAPAPWLIGMGVVMIALTLITTVGLFRFWSPARPMYLASMALAYLVAPLAPVVVQTAFASTLFSLAALLAGLMVGLMYFSPAASEFRRREA